MKVVLSRKGMDSRAGGIPSPILPDGTLLSLPIPNEKSGVPYGDLVYKGRTYQQIIQQIHPTFDFFHEIIFQQCKMLHQVYDLVKDILHHYNAVDFQQALLHLHHFQNIMVHQIRSLKNADYNFLSEVHVISEQYALSD